MAEAYKEYFEPGDQFRVAHVRPARRRVRAEDAETAPPFYVQQRTYLMPEASVSSSGRSRSHSTGARGGPVPRRPAIYHAATDRGRRRSHLYEYEADDYYYDSRDPSPYSGYSGYSGRSRSRAGSRRRSSYAGSREPSPYPKYDDYDDSEKEEMKKQLIRYKKEKRREDDDSKRKEIEKQVRKEAEEHERKKSIQREEERARIKKEIDELATKKEQQRKDEEERRKRHDKEVIEAYERKMKEEKEKADADKKKREQEMNETIRKRFAGKVSPEELDRILTGKDQKEKEALATLGWNAPTAPNPLFGFAPSPVPGQSVPVPMGSPFVPGQGQMPPPQQVPGQFGMQPPFPPVPGQAPVDMSKPVVMKINRQHLSTKSLNYFGIPFEINAYDKNFIMIRGFYSPEERQKWFNHTDWLRSQRVMAYNPVIDDGMVEWTGTKRDRRKSGTVKEDTKKPVGFFTKWAAGA